MPLDRRSQVVAEGQRIDKTVDRLAVAPHREQPENNGRNGEKDDCRIISVRRAVHCRLSAIACRASLVSSVSQPGQQRREKSKNRKKARHPSDIKRVLAVVALRRAKRTAETPNILTNAIAVLLPYRKRKRAARVAFDSGVPELLCRFRRHRPVSDEYPALLGVVFRGVCAEGLTFLYLLVASCEIVHERASEARAADCEKRGERHRRALHPFDKRRASRVSRHVMQNDSQPKHKIRRRENRKEQPQVGLVHRTPRKARAKQKPVSRLTLLKRPVDEPEGEDSVSHPLEPAEVPGGKEREPVAGERQKKPRAVSRDAGKPSSAKEIRHSKRRHKRGEGVLELCPDVGTPDPVDRLGRRELPVFEPADEPGAKPVRRVRRRTVRHHRRHLGAPRPPENIGGAHGEDRRERREPPPFRADAHLRPPLEPEPAPRLHNRAR